MRSLVLIVTTLSLLAAGPIGGREAADSGLRLERVFGPEVPTGRYKHPASMTELRNGDLYLVYYGGDGEYAPGTAVFGSRLRKGTTIWPAPRAIAHDPFRSLGNAVVWQAPDDVVWLFYVVRYGATWSTSRIQAKISRDNAETWSDAFMITLDEGMMVRNRPIVLTTGDYLLPIYQEKGHDTEVVGPDSTSMFLRYDQKGKQWLPAGRIASKTGNIQPAVVELTPMRLIAYLPPRRRIRSDQGRLHRPLGVAGWRGDVGGGTELRVSEPELGHRVHEAAQRSAAPRVQRQHDRAHTADSRALDRRRSDLSAASQHRRGAKQLCVSNRIPGVRWPDPHRVHVRPAIGDQPRRVWRGLGETGETVA